MDTYNIYEYSENWVSGDDKTETPIGKSIICKIYTMWQILENIPEKRIDPHTVDFKAAFRSFLYATVYEFGIPAKKKRVIPYHVTSLIWCWRKL